VTARATAEQKVIIVHDTTQFYYGVDSNRRGLGRSRKSNSTFFAHVSFAPSTHGYLRPLGVAALQTYVRNDELENEYARWAEGVSLTRKCLGNTRAIHLMDREVDDYTFMCKMVAESERFVIRSRNDRMLGEESEQPRLSDALNIIRGTLEREVQVTKRTDGDRPPALKKKHPVRASRIAQLAIGAAPVTLKKPSSRTKSAVAYGPRPDVFGGPGGNGALGLCTVDPSCSAGILNGAGTACCDPRCGACGGVGCQSYWDDPVNFTLTVNAACCQGNILASTRQCSNTRAPCKM